MRRFIFLCATFLFLSFAGFALEFPPPPAQRVNDFAGVLTSQEKSDLESQLQQHEKQTSNQIVVAIFPSLEQESLEDYANRLFEKWKIGQKVNNNGVLLIVFLKERQVRIEVGYGLEGTLTDALSSRIIRNELAPDFRAGKYGAGVTKATLAIQKAIAGEYKPLAGQDRPQTPTPGFSPSTIFIAMMVLFYIVHRVRNRAMYIDHKGRRRQRDDDGWFIFPGGGWGSGGGSGWGGGGGGWGGGGGFSGGGGMSGGGGASGSW